MKLAARLIGSLVVFCIAYYTLMLIAGHLFQYASNHGYILSDRDISRSLMWSIGVSVVVALAAAATAFRVSRRLG